jgi:hypothetical protein
MGLSVASAGSGRPDGGLHAKGKARRGCGEILLQQGNQTSGPATKTVSRPLSGMFALSQWVRRRILTFDVCDWLRETKDLLLDRGMMGDGVADLRQIRSSVEDAGFQGRVEVEIFSRDN